MTTDAAMSPLSPMGCVSKKDLFLGITMGAWEGLARGWLQAEGNPALNTEARNIEELFTECLAWWQEHHNFTDEELEAHGLLLGQDAGLPMFLVTILGERMYELQMMRRQREDKERRMQALYEKQKSAWVGNFPPDVPFAVAATSDFNRRSPPTSDFNRQSLFDKLKGKLMG